MTPPIPGPLGTVANFSDTDIATLSRASAHTVTFDIVLQDRRRNDVVNIYIDGVLKGSGTTWEDYYRYDPEQTGNGNAVPSTQQAALPRGRHRQCGNAGNGFLVDGVSLTSSASSDLYADRLHARRPST